MRAFRSLSPWLVSALLLVACGGGDPDVPGSGSPAGAPTTKGNFTAVVSFGDSLSDIGSYAPATSLAGNGTPPFFGGKFTTNETSTGAPDANPLGKVWVENVAASLGIIVTPAEVGFAGSSVKCPAAAVPALANSCTAYGQGGSRVTDPNGYNHSGGLLTVPVVTQIDNHLARFGSFKDTDLIVILAGDNEAFTQLDIFATTAAQVQAKAAAGQITADQANQLLFQAQITAQTAMKQAAQELAGYVKTKILANGGKYVAVINPIDLRGTPFYAGLVASPATAPVAGVASALVDTFDLWLRDGLTGVPVQLINLNPAIQAIYANPAGFGFTDITTPACDAAKISAVTGGAVTSGSSLFCNATPGAPYNGLRTGADANTWFFADDVHPTTGAQALFGTEILKQLQAAGWI
ncbi:MAG: SGNH/GDSL hydrolase family protein [Caldimonas sp.]